MLITEKSTVRLHVHISPQQKAEIEALARRHHAQTTSEHCSLNLSLFVEDQNGPGI